MLPSLDNELKELEQFFRKLPKLAGVQYLNFFLDSFRKQGFRDKTRKKWTKRARADKNKKKRNLLVKTGRLQRSLKLSTRTNKIIIGTSVPYAEIHNEGGDIKGSVKVRAHKRKQKVGRGKKKKIKKVDVMAHNRRVSTRIPQRQFMGQSQAMDDKITKLIERNLIKIFK